MTARLAHALAPLARALAQDPVFTYSLLAAALLALVSLATGLLRRDLAVLFRPRLLLRVVIAVLLAFGLWLGGSLLRPALPAAPLLDGISAVARLPLYLVALAYGPGVGLVAGALFAGLQAGGGTAGWNAVMLVLELAVLGWLAIYPSPRSVRWAGPFDAALGYALAWGTGGLALLESRHGAVTLAGLWAQQQHLLLGVGISVALLALVPPRVYRDAFPESRILPPGSRARPSDDGARYERTPNEALERVRAGARDPMKLTYPELPRVLRRGRRRRELEPFPGLGEERDDRDG